MMELRSGTIPLFRLAGVDVFLHWSWFVVALFEMNDRSGRYSGIIWHLSEYLALFFIVLMHEFGHALACRQVGGVANRIVLWPLGGVAYVSPPQRPGATLWSIAAGPLVNVALLPILFVVVRMCRTAGMPETMPSSFGLLRSLFFINLGLLIFNMLPIYPLDGGQILRSLLWYVLGRARSLMVATYVGFVGVAGLIGLAVWLKAPWFAVLSAFILLNCWNGLRHAQALAKIAKLPRRVGYACPSCKAAPPVGAIWKCSKCTNIFDTFESQGVCPLCRTQFPTTACFECGALHPISEWMSTAPAPPGL
ncbi:MAG TPA: M50 family metallopeptidase [Candidatus Solibacter sp.]|nr:M50 family metallopeptidase [Candidatus Solibacter sp.]